MRLSLHTWTLDRTPLADVLAVIRAVGWDAVELRRIDFARAAQAGQSADEVLGLVGRSGLPVACVGVELGWMWAEGDERTRLLAAFAESCAWARTLGCGVVMSPVDKGTGDAERAMRSIREVGDLAAAHRVRLALEFNSQAEQWNTLGAVDALVRRAGHPHVGLLVDAYHLQRSGGKPADVTALRGEDIVYVQFSDVAPRTEPGVFLDRLPPGRGVVPFKEFFAAVRAVGYDSYCSYEAPNPAAWSRPADAVAREALEATRSVL
ncbi:MAG: sugar phosphate isomerase/epimerase [Candidatus Rokubacteria bacterium]|nr:sugar phosphate isomerase/epimerase [Candidatus Rokubacteria bacterium]MBI3825669.1 sugar phosphate isomerase/epimerase [Candidatus Rokubacteria bacterium]